MRLPIDQVKPNPKNPRIIKDDKFKKLVQSIKDFPEMAKVREIVVNKEYVILGGNMRFRAMQEAGWDEVHVRVVDWPEEKQKEFIIKDNIANGEWDFELLANEYDAEKLGEWGLDIDFDDDEVVEDEAPALAEGEANSNLGQVYELGRHRLMCGDATKKEDVEKLMGGIKADMVFTDPPYKAAMQGAGLAIDKKSVRDWGDYGSGSNFDLLDYGNDFHNIVFDLSDNILYLVTYNQVHDLVSEAIKRKCRHRILPICKTTSPFPSSGNWSIDMNWGVHIYKKPKGKFNNRSWHMIDKATDTNAKKDVAHPSPYRIDLLVKFIGIVTEQDGVVVDLFGGGGSILIAAEQTGRTCYMMEIDPKYCDVIRKRYDNFVNSK